MTFGQDNRARLQCMTIRLQEDGYRILLGETQRYSQADRCKVGLSLSMKTGLAGEQCWVTSAGLYDSSVACASMSARAEGELPLLVLCRVRTIFEEGIINLDYDSILLRRVLLICLALLRLHMLHPYLLRVEIWHCHTNSFQDILQLGMVPSIPHTMRIGTLQTRTNDKFSSKSIDFAWILEWHRQIALQRTSDVCS